MTNLQIRQVRSTIGCQQNQRDTLRTLGLKHVGDVVVRENRPEFRGMLATVTHLIDIQEVE